MNNRHSLRTHMVRMLAVCALAVFGLAGVFTVVAPAQTAYGSTLNVEVIIDNYDELSDQSKSIVDSSGFSYDFKFFSEVRQLDYSINGQIPVSPIVKSPTLKRGANTVFISNRIPYFYVTPNDRTDSHISFSHMEFGSGAAQLSYPMSYYGRKWDLPGYGQFTQLASSGWSGSIKLHFRYNEELGPVKLPKPDIAIKTTKQIDYLGDGNSNADTQRKGPNDYRTYLSAQAADNSNFPKYRRKNFIIVADVSGSMRERYLHGSSESKMDSLKRNLSTMVNKLGTFDNSNTFSILAYSNTVQPVLNKGSYQQAAWAINRLTAGGGTNTGGALMEVQRYVDHSPDVDNVLLLVTDGLPTEIPYNYFGASYGGYNTSVDVVYPATQLLLNQIKGIDSLYSIFIGSGRGASVLQSITQGITTRDEKAAFSVNSDTEMKNMLDSLMLRLKNPEVHITISCQLSEDVTLYPNSYKLVATGADGRTRELNYGVDYTVAFDGATRTVTATIVNKVNEDTKYRFSFDERTSTAAIKKWLAANESYPHVGDADTDYDLANPTSTAKPGFYDIDKAEAQVKYVAQDGTSTGETFTYPKPVVQVYFKPNNKGKVSAHVVLYNMKLSPNMFMFELVDADGNVIEVAGNDTDGNVYFKDIPYKREGTYTYTIRPVVPKPGESGFMDNMRYDNHTVPVKVKVEVKDDDFSTQVEYDPDNIYHESYGLKGVVN
ncbi:MAG: VWA domain-containing protein [Atopobium sp.]|uniref:DUF7604 domain-containing protein n=1 Tax=Atopobium sp. TaxID=1872650 RepID=UPI002A831016|nr:VWA domain-containing protein [Atopobium sp.]MDY4522266.1 VWA domain-containing protein [Atopobium sp.]